MKRELQLSARWLEYPTEGECESRAYQGVTVADIGGAKHLVVYGGIHDSAASESLQLLNLAAKEWFTPHTEGQAPNGCMGCSAAYIPAASGSSRSQVVFIGGSDGNDLLRYGTTDITSIGRSCTRNKLGATCPAIVQVLAT